MKGRVVIRTSVFCLSAYADQAPQAPARYVEAGKARNAYVDELEKLRQQAMSLESSLVLNLKANTETKTNIKRLQMLIRLQQQEKQIGQKRMEELEDTVRELEIRRESLNEKVANQRKSVWKFLGAIESSTRSSDFFSSPLGWEQEASEAPRRKLLANLTSRGLKELEILKADLQDADHLESRIQEEKQQLANLFQDLNERESVLELNRQLQVDLLKKNHAERVAQLESYSHLKESQAQVETMIGEFNARKELEKAVENERIANRESQHSDFERLKGKLGLPVLGGHVVAGFGRAFDPRSKLFIFKKGIDIQTGKGQSVQAIYPGKIAYSGELPDYGRVAIIDHGNHFYSLCAHLGELSKKAGEVVAAGDSIGMADDSGIVYFEIRSRNMPVNPLQWVADSSTLKSTTQ